MDKQIVEEIYIRNYETEIYYKRDYYNSLNYTEGIMDFQKTLNAFWVVDCIIGHLQKVYETVLAVDDGFFIVTIIIDKVTNIGHLEIYREGYMKGKYNKHITVSKQIIPNIDLPQYDYKFYLILTQTKPVLFTLLLTSEY